MATSTFKAFCTYTACVRAGSPPASAESSACGRKARGGGEGGLRQSSSTFKEVFVCNTCGFSRSKKGNKTDLVVFV